MHKFNTYVALFSCLLLQATLTTGSMTTVPEDRNETAIDRIGVILDQTSRAGKEAKVAIEIAIQGFNNETTQHSVLYYKTSRSKAVHAATAAKELIDEHKVKAIVGGHTWEEASAIAEAISEANHDHDIPMFLSLATPLQEPNQWPFFIEAVPTQATQITALVAILQSLGMHHVTLIYETSSSASIISHISRAFRKTSSELTNILPLTSNPSSLDEELELLKKQQRKVFVVHTSLELGVRIFQEAKKMEMTGDGYLWITTNQITDLFHSINSTVISSLKGMVGVKTYFPQNNPEFLDFKKRFRQKFQSNYPEEHQDEPGIFALVSLVAFSLSLFLLQASLTTGRITRIGVILDQTSRPRKEAKVTIEIALQDFNNKTNLPSVLNLHNSQNPFSFCSYEVNKFILKNFD